MILDHNLYRDISKVVLTLIDRNHGGGGGDLVGISKLEYGRFIRNICLKRLIYYWERDEPVLCVSKMAGGG